MTEKRFLPAGQPANPPLSRHPNTRQRILVVDDDFVIRRVNTGVLTYSGYQVDAAEDGADAGTLCNWSATISWSLTMTCQT